VQYINIKYDDFMIENAPETGTAQPEPSPIPDKPDTHPDHVIPPDGSSSPDVSDTHAEPDKGDEDTDSAEDEMSARERAIEVAEGLFQRKHGEIKSRGTATKDEEQLLLVGTYARGFDKHNFSEDSIGTGGLKMPLEDKGEVTVEELTAQTKNPDDGSVSYSYKGKDASGEEFTGAVSGADLASAQLTQQQEAILRNFSGDHEKTLIKWQASGADENDIPIDAVEAVAQAESSETPTESTIEDAERFQIADQFIDGQVKELSKSLPEGSIDKLDRTKMTPEQKSAVKEIELLQASKIDGPLGVLTRDQAVSHLLETKYKKKNTSITLKLAHQALADKKEPAYEEINNDLINAGLSDDDADLAMGYLKDEKIIELLDPDTKDNTIKKLQEKNPNLTEAIFKGNDVGKMTSYLDTFISNLDPKDKRAVAWKVAKGAGYIGLALIFIVLGTSGLAIAGTSQITGGKRAA
jgi:hypothetical protein